MANLARVRCTWSGITLVGAGVSTFYVDEADTGFTAAILALFSSCGFTLPPGTAVTVPASGDLIDVATGELSGTWTDGPGGSVSGSGSGTFSLGVGLRLVWNTSGIRNGRRVKGSTFIVPTVGGIFAADGTISNTTLSALQTGVNTFMTSMGTNLKIYSRPVPGVGGQANTVIGGVVPDAVSWLRTRRT